MHEWNVVITVSERGYRQAIELLEEFGSVGRTEFFNVLVMQTGEIEYLMETLRERILKNPEIRSFLARIIPLSRTFNFQTPEEFETKAKELVLVWLPELAGKSFHVRMHRRGFKGRLSSPDEERFLDKILLESLEKAGTPGRISFDDPDAILVIETLGQRAGFSLWTRDEMELYPFLRLD